jgi:hypothetical protein
LFTIAAIPSDACAGGTPAPRGVEGAEERAAEERAEENPTLHRAASLVVVVVGVAVVRANFTAARRPGTVRTGVFERSRPSI